MSFRFYWEQLLRLIHSSSRARQLLEECWVNYLGRKEGEAELKNVGNLKHCTCIFLRNKNSVSSDPLHLGLTFLKCFLVF